MNLLNETLDDITRSGHTIKDIVFIGSEESGHSCTWDEFHELADFEYDAGYGAAHVALDLRIVFSDGQQMTRGEYDGQEWWQVHEVFEHPVITRKIHTLGSNAVMWERLEGLNEGL